MSVAPDTCRLCGAALSAPAVAGERVYGGSPEQRFYACPVCRVAFLHPPLAPADEDAFYAKEFERFMEKRAGADFDWSGPEEHVASNRKQYERRESFFTDLVAPGSRVLEMGCSSGFMLLPLKERGCEVVGVEPSCGFGNYLRSREVAVYESLDALEAAGEGGFDVLMHFFVLEHVRDPLGFLRRTAALLRPGGAMVFEVPSRDDPLVTIYDIPAFRDFYWQVAHNWYFDRASLTWLLDSLGMPYTIEPEQRYDLSNHMTWAIEGRPGGQGRYADSLTPELQEAYLASMERTGHCDTLVGRVTVP